MSIKRDQQVDSGSTGSDEVLNITSAKKTKKKKSRAQKRELAAAKEKAMGGDKRRKVVIVTENNITREFHKHSKVATSALPSNRQETPLKSAIKKPRQDKQNEKMRAKVAKFAV